MTKLVAQTAIAAHAPAFGVWSQGVPRASQPVGCASGVDMTIPAIVSPAAFASAMHVRSLSVR